MEKLKFKISISILIIIITMITVFNTISSAASAASIKCSSSVETGKSFTISLNLPAESYGAQADIKVDYPDGSSESHKIVYVSGMADSPNSATFTAKGSGKATITATNIIISKADSTAIEQGGSTSKTIDITSKPAVNNTVKNTTTNTTPTPTNTTAQTNTTTTNTTTDTSSKETFKDVNETVYVCDTETLNIRKTNSRSGTVLGKVKKGTKLTRTGIGSVEWSRVTYNGQTGYAITSCLTTTVPKETETNTTFKEVNEKMYANTNCNLRKEADKNSDLVGSLSKDEEVTRIGIGTGADGASWSKIKYNGKEVYVKSSLLTNKKPEVDNTVNEISNNTIDNNIVNETNIVDTNAILETIKEEVGVLPEVGTNPAVIIHHVICVLAIAFSVALIYINKNND